MKPQLPPCLCDQLPDDVLNLIQSFVPHLPKPKPVKPRSSPSLSPSAERDLRLIQSKALRGMDAMYMRDLDDFILY